MTDCPLLEWAGWWDKTIERWHAEGLPGDLTDRYAICRHFDNMTMDKGEGAMRAEFERLLPTAARGGFLISCDHQTPPGVSYQNYLTYLALFKEYALKAGRG